jgi:hypothetical protein
LFWSIHEYLMTSHMGSLQGSYYHIINRPIKDEPTKSVGIKTEYTPIAVSD